MRFSDLCLLLEVNLFNKDTLIIHLDEILRDKNVRKPEIRNWFIKQYVPWYISSKDDNVKMHSVYPHTYREGEPEWAKKEGIYDFDYFNIQDVAYLHHTIDYFNQLEDIDLKKIFKEPYEIIQRKVAEWDERLRNQKVMDDSSLKEGVDIETVLKFKDGFSFVRLLSKKAYDLEGQQMGHCVGSYWDETHGNDENYGDDEGEQGEGQYEYEPELYAPIIYSLRDPKGLPHVTIEVRGESVIHQIKGKENAPPIPKYVPYIKQFIEDEGFVVETGDGKDIGMFEFNGEYYFEDSEKFQAIYRTVIEPLRKKRITEYFEKAKQNKGIIDEVDLGELYLTELPDFSEFTITGSFDCGGNMLKDLKGAPRKVGGGFVCNNNRLTTLEGAPQTAHYFDCHNNKLITLEGGPQIVNSNFYCHNNQLTSLKGSPKLVKGGFHCNNNRLTTLKGAPAEVGGDFDCYNNQLTTLEGAPIEVGKRFACNTNQLTSLKGSPAKVGGDFICEFNPVKFTNEDIAQAMVESRAKNTQSFKEYYQATNQPSLA